MENGDAQRRKKRRGKKRARFRSPAEKNEEGASEPDGKKTQEKKGTYAREKKVTCPSSSHTKAVYGAQSQGDKGTTPKSKRDGREKNVKRIQWRYSSLEEGKITLPQERKN